MSTPSRWVGVMSGTSLDGVDAVLVEIGSTGSLHVLHHVHLPMPPDLRAVCLALNHTAGDELHRSQVAGNHLAHWYAQSVRELLAQASCPADTVRAVGVHGQTVRHHPVPLADDPWSAYTVQLNNPSLLAELIHIDVIAQFRERDIAAGGQGAPLVPAFHRQMFAAPEQDVAVVNVGGIANVSWLAADGQCLGWDSGPGNMLLDAWCEQHTGQAWDEDGAWGATGRLQPELLSAWLQDPYFARHGAKTSGREHFHVGWLRALSPALDEYAPPDVQATLVALTAHTIAASLPHPPDKLLLCGGGALNCALVTAVADRLPSTRLADTSAAGLPVMQVEAAAFAWLAWAWTQRHPGNWPAATGAKGLRVLGALFPAG
jgi:anhydro-N-acetylmuramic acid kinase